MKVFWLKLFAILMAVALSFSVFLSWFFAGLESRNFNRQSQSYLSKQFSLLYRDIQLSLKKNSLSSFASLQKIISFYSSKPTKNSKLFSKSAPEISQISIINESGIVLAHSEPSYKKNALSRSSPFLSLIREYPKGWNQIDKTSSPSVITIAKPVVISSTRYFVTLHHPAKKTTDLFVSYFKWTLLFGSVFFMVLCLMIFLYLKSLADAKDFLLRVFGARSFLPKTKKGTALSFPKESERKKALSHLARTENTYLKSIRPSLVSFLQANQKPPEKMNFSELSFSDIVDKAIFQSRLMYPDLKIEREITADIKLPVFADKLFQVLWELIKNGFQALQERQEREIHLNNGKNAELNGSKALPSDKKIHLNNGKNAEQADIYSAKEETATKTENPAKKVSQQKSLKIRTFKKQNKWFCCEVEDEGPGMTRTMMEKASQLYFTTKKNSTGLGLPFIQSVLSRIGGIMKLQSSEKRGLKVSLFIPLDYITHIQFLKETGAENQRTGAENQKTGTERRNSDHKVRV